MNSKLNVFLNGQSFKASKLQSDTELILIVSRKSEAGSQPGRSDHRGIVSLAVFPLPQLHALLLPNSFINSVIKI